MFKLCENAMAGLRQSEAHRFLEFFINFNYSLINVFAPVVHQKKQEANAQDKKSSDEQISGVEP